MCAHQPSEANAAPLRQPLKPDASLDAKSNMHASDVVQRPTRFCTEQLNSCGMASGGGVLAPSLAARQNQTTIDKRTTHAPADAGATVDAV